MHIAIVGGSLSGAFLAFELQNSGHQISIIDPNAPWEKPCGGGVYADVLRQFPILRDVCAWNYPPRLKLILSNGEKVLRLASSSAWAIVSRNDLNQSLLKLSLQNSNVRLISERVLNVKEQKDKWQIETANGQIEADILIGADGVHSVVRKNLIGKIPREHLGVTVGYMVSNSPLDEVIIKTQKNTFGYMWYFPRHDHASVGIMAKFGDDVAELWRQVDVFLNTYFPQAHKESRWGAQVPLVSSPEFWKLPCPGKNWALLGDAAGHVNSIIGEGIPYALSDAHLAAQAILQGDIKNYEQAWRKEHGNWMRLSSQIVGAVNSGASSGHELAIQMALSGNMQLANIYIQTVWHVNRFAKWLKVG